MRLKLLFEPNNNVQEAKEGKEGKLKRQTWTPPPPLRDFAVFDSATFHQA